MAQLMRRNRMISALSGSPRAADLIKADRSAQSFGFCSAAFQSAQHVRGSEHDSSDKREHAGKQHNVDDELDHLSFPRFTPEIPSRPLWSFVMYGGHVGPY